VVGDKVEEPDATGENDVYEAAVNFTLAFVPMENDDLLMQLKYTDENGVEHVITKRLAGTNAEGEDYESIVPAEDGSYTIGGLKLSENQEFTFDLNLKGLQNLEKGVYIYQSYVSDEHPESQTMVGISEGKQEVSVKASMTVTFSVDENNSVVAERSWNEEGDPTTEEIPPEEEELPPPVEEELPPPPVFEVNVEDDTIEIPEEPVPLADAPKTGSNAIIWVALTLSAAMALAATCISDKKQHNTF